jgi:hypothetical protein
MKKILTLIVIAVLAGNNICQARQSYIANLSSLNEIPPTNLSPTEGTYGIGYFSLSGLTLSVIGGFYDYSYPVVEVSLYDGPVTVGATPAFQLNIDPDASPVGGGFYAGTFSGSAVLSPSQLTDLEGGNFWVNIQTGVSQMAGQPGEEDGEILSEIPEPATMILMGAGSVTCLAMRRRKARASRDFV